MRLGEPPLGPTVVSVTIFPAARRMFIRICSVTYCVPDSACGEKRKNPLYRPMTSLTSRINGALSLYRQWSCLFSCLDSRLANVPRSRLPRRAPGDYLRHLGKVPSSLLGTAEKLVFPFRNSQALLKELSLTVVFSWCSVYTAIF